VEGHHQEQEQEQEQGQVAAVFLRPFQFRNGNRKACTTTHMAKWAKMLGGCTENHIKVIGT